MKEIQKVIPEAGQESVWDYPRPPKVELSDKHILVKFENLIVAESVRTLRITETSHAPSYYIPFEDVKMEHFGLTTEISFCEFKGKANYYQFRYEDETLNDVAWTYLKPSKHFLELVNYLSFYPDRGMQCYVDGELATPQEGGFYGGWITSDIVGPFKGVTGSWGW